jgi:hypothetical protein
MRIAVVLFLIPFLAAAQSRRTRTPSSSLPGNIMGPTVTFHGTLKSIDNKQVLIESEEQTVVLGRTHKTHFLKDEKEIKPKDIPAGAALTIDVNKAPDGSLLAVNVFVDTAKPGVNPGAKPDSK